MQFLSLQGWLTKVKHGHSRRVWCLLVGKMFVYFKNPSDINPAGQINMRDSRVEEVEHISSDSDSDETDENRTQEPTLGIFPNHVQQVQKHIQYFTNTYRPRQPNWEFSMWKFKDISATQILREINFGYFQAPKSVILTN